MTGSPHRPERHVSASWLGAALLVWAVLCFGHGVGLDVVGWVLEWSRTPGALSQAGGQGGAIRAERILAAAFLVLLAAGAGWFVWRQRRHAGALPVLLGPWILWAALVGLAWKTIIVYTTELVHFAQYGLIALLLAAALDRGARPQRAFVFAFGLGLADEVWQHYGLHVWLLGERNHYLDFSDPLLNGLGACGGALIAASRCRLVGQGVSDSGFLRRAFLVLAVLLVPVLFVDPVTLSRWMGSYVYDPFWHEFPNLKPVHWVTPYEGAPLILACFLFLGALVDPRRTAPSVDVVAVTALMVLLAVRPPSRSEGRPVHEPVPRVVVPRIEDAAITVDGRLDEPAWTAAARVGPFRHNDAGGHELPLCAGGAPAPMAATHARLLWDARALFVAFEVGDDDVWFHPAGGGERTPAETDEGVHILIDDGGDELTFYEFAVNAANRVADRFLFVPSAPIDYNPWGRPIGLHGWTAEGLLTAVAVLGTAEPTASRFQPPASPDTGYVVEVAIPWEVFRTTTVPSSLTVRTSVPPEPGQRWRLGLYRVDRARTPQSVASGIVPPSQAAAILGGEAELERALASRRVAPRDGGFSREEVWNEVLHRCTATQAWSPTWLAIERATHFGVMEFGGPPP